MLCESLWIVLCQPKVMATSSLWFSLTYDFQDHLRDEGFAWLGRGRIWWGCASFMSLFVFVAPEFLHTSLGRDEGDSDLSPSKTQVSNLLIFSMPFIRCWQRVFIIAPGGSTVYGLCVAVDPLSGICTFGYPSSRIYGMASCGTVLSFPNSEISRRDAKQHEKRTFIAPDFWWTFDIALCLPPKAPHSGWHDGDRVLSDCDR